MTEAVEYLSGSKHFTLPEQNIKLVSVRYEDLVQDLELEVQNICTYTSRTFHCFHYLVDKTTFTSSQPEVQYCH